MQFKKCVCCGLELPLSILVPIQVRHNGQIVTVPICSRCKEIKEAEAKRRQNDTP
jgi:hypothetical protein